jgi:hypothetical protein
LGQECRAGSCTAVSTKCIDGQTLCGTPPSGTLPYCSFLMTDSANCGACGNLLPPGQMCLGGEPTEYFTIPAWECDLLKTTGTYKYCSGPKPPICIAGDQCPG